MSDKLVGCVKKPFCDARVEGDLPHQHEEGDNGKPVRIKYVKKILGQQVERGLPRYKIGKPEKTYDNHGDRQFYARQEENQYGNQADDSCHQPFIGTPGNLPNITNKDEAFGETAEPERIRDRIEGQVAGDGQLARCMESHAHQEEIPAYEKIDRDAYNPRGDVHGLLHLLRTFYIKEVDKDVPAQP